MTNVTGQEEQTVIYQAVQRLVQSVWAANNERDKVQRQLHAERMNHNAPVVTSRDLMDRISLLEQRNQDLIDEVDKLRDYGRLKDNAKRKVEQQRDAYCEVLEVVTVQRDELLRDVQAVEQLKAQNAAQASAFQAMESQVHAEQRLRMEYAERVKNLEEVIILGRRGLQAENSAW